MTARLRTLARREDGFGMPELLLAMTILVVGVFAVFGLFSSGVITLRRASTVATTSSLADAQLENFRAVRFETIGLTSAAVSGAGATYQGDAAYLAPGTNLVNQAVTLTSSTYSPTQTLTAPDGRSYRVDTYITWQATSSGSGTTTGRNVKLVTIVVRDTTTPTKVWARVASAFDQTTGT
jgi:Tfp pilus assembly protein PilV